MEPKLQALLSSLVAVVPSGQVEYRYENMRHKFRLEHDGRSHWLYIAREFVADHTESELVASLFRWQIPATFLDSESSHWLFLSEAGVREVDDRFGKIRG